MLVNLSSLHKLPNFAISLPWIPSPTPMRPVAERRRRALERTRRRLPASGLLMAGMRGVGKTVLLVRMRDGAEAVGIQIASRRHSNGTRGAQLTRSIGRKP